MKLTFKDLKQQKFVVEAEPTDTIGQVKEKIASEKGWAANTQKLIYSGKILQDANTVASYNIQEAGFIVCMVSKPKAAPAASVAASSSNPPSTPAPPQAATPAPPAAPAPSASTSAPANPPATPSPAAPAANAATFNDPSALLVGNQSQEATAQMEAMGFPRADIDRAMRAAFFNPDRAIEYLLTGIPENVEQEARQATPAARSPNPPAAAAPAATTEETGDQPINLFEAAAQAGSGGSGGRGARSSGAGAGSNPFAGLTAGADRDSPNLDFLRTNPHFQQLRQLVQQQPAMLEPILQQVSAGNPQLAQLISQNQEQFLQLLSEDVDDDAELPPGAHAISVTEEEREAIERLCRLGFERNAVIQAYFACDKNEELAANFLFDQPEEDDQQ